MINIDTEIAKVNEQTFIEIWNDDFFQMIYFIDM